MFFVEFRNTKLEIEQKKRDYLEENEKLLALKRKLNDAKELYENVNLKHKTLEKKMQRMKTELIEITKYIEEASKKYRIINYNNSLLYLSYMIVFCCCI